MTSERIGKIERKTRETYINLQINIDGKGKFLGTSHIGFFDHMLELLAKHSSFDIKLTCQGDLEVDSHHLIEDLGISMGLCLNESLKDKKGIQRYASVTLPMDEVLTMVSIDLSSRAYYVGNFSLKREKIGDFECEMLREFLYALAINGKMNLHVNNFYGENDHHKVESIFKALARALKDASRIVSDEILSTKGVL